jgi:hypothetical protein
MLMQHGRQLAVKGMHAQVGLTMTASSFATITQTTSITVRLDLLLGLLVETATVARVAANATNATASAHSSTSSSYKVVVLLR